ncbi:hypothetical protein EON63_12725 [archaeon]|nr:MAG: hypothetical protein EON63_12725 [archaeon]
MDFESLLFVPNRLIDDYRNQLKELLEEPEDVAEELKVPEIEKAEALEALGMSEFYQGDYQTAWKHLKESLAYQFSASVRSSRRVCLCIIYLGICR